MSDIDTRYVYSIGCTWNDSIDKVGTRGGYPACPSCGSLLLEMESIKQWNRQIDAHNENHPGYRDFATWLRGRCFKTYDDALKVYQAETGKVVQA